jgi:hypothetical protein
MITTISTVGYGDFTPKTSEERIIVSFLMLLGVCSFTYIVGALSSILTASDTG